MFRPGRIFWALAFIAVGLLFLWQELSNGAFDAGAVIDRWWPLLVVGLGLAVVAEAAWRRPGGVDVPVAVDLGAADSAIVRIDFGAGMLHVGPAAPGRLVDGVLGGGGRVETAGPGRVRLAADPGAFWSAWPGARGFRWNVGVAAGVPVALRVDTGASDNRLDLGDLRVTDLEVHAGASETRIALPRAAGMTTVRVEAGAASVRVRVPDGVAARITGAMALGGARVDERRFPRAAGTAGPGSGWISPDWGTAANRVDITFRGGVGGVVVE